MSIYSGPDIVTDGLVLHLDAADKNSYPGSGNTWYDLSGKDNNLSWSSPSPSLNIFNNNVVIDTGPVSSTLRAVRSYSYNGIRTGTSGYTALSFFKPNSTASRKMILSFGPANSVCDGQAVHPIAINNVGKFGGGSCGGRGTWNTSTGVTPTTDRYWYVCTTYDGSIERIYVNGTLDKSASMTSNTPISSANAISLGWIRDDGASYVMDADIGIIMIYNRVLSPQEILQNYNATKTRFGLT